MEKAGKGYFFSVDNTVNVNSKVYLSFFYFYFYAYFFSVETQRRSRGLIKRVLSLLLSPPELSLTRARQLLT